MSQLSTGTIRRWQPGYGVRSGAAAVLVALLIFADIEKGGLHRAEETVAIAVAIGFIAIAARFPGVALCTMFVFVPLQVAGLAWLFKQGVPAQFVKDLGYVKDGATAGILLAMFRGGPGIRHRARLDFLDWAAITYVGIATIYLIIPTLAHGSLGGLSFQVRLNAWRLDCLFVVLMFAARRVHFSKQALHAARATVVAVGLILLVVAIRESISSSWYNHFLDFTVNLPNYQLQILKVAPPRGGDYVVNTIIAGLSVQRDGSLFADPIALGFYMVIPFALCLHQLGDHRPRPWFLIGLAGSAATLVLAETRSPILSAVVAIVLAVVLAFQSRSPGRYRLAVLVVAAAVLALPLSAHSDLRQRFANTINNTSSADNTRHESAVTQSVKKIINDPLGVGLGSNPASGQRFSTSTLTFSEDSFLQIGVELGAPAMLAFIAMYLALLSRLYQEARRRTERSSVAGGMWLAGWALFVGGLFLHVWLIFQVSLTFWGLAGAAIGPPGEYETHAPRRRLHRRARDLGVPALAGH